MTRMMMVLALLGAVGWLPDQTGATELKYCGADKVQDLVGRSVAGPRAGFPENARIIPANSAITRDFRRDHLNVDLNASGLITRIWCG